MLILIPARAEQWLKHASVVYRTNTEIANVPGTVICSSNIRNRVLFHVAS